MVTFCKFGNICRFEKQVFRINETTLRATDTIEECSTNYRLHAMF